MTGRATAITIISCVLGASAIWSGASVWKHYIDQETELLREQSLWQHQLSMSQEQTNRLQIIHELMDKDERVELLWNEQYKAMEAILKSMEPNDQLIVEDELIVDGKTAQQITKTPRETRKPREPRTSDRLDGNFIILSVDSGKVRDGHRAKIQSVETGDKLSVSIPGGTISDDQITEIQSGEWGKKELYMKINIVRSGDRIIRATLVRANLAAPIGTD